MCIPLPVVQDSGYISPFVDPIFVDKNHYGKTDCLQNLKIRKKCQNNKKCLDILYQSNLYKMWFLNKNDTNGRKIQGLLNNNDTLGFEEY